MQSVAHFLTFSNPMMSLVVAFSVLSLYVSVCNKSMTCLWEVVERGHLGYFCTVGLLPQILKLVWPALLITVSLPLLSYLFARVYPFLYFLCGVVAWRE